MLKTIIKFFAAISLIATISQANASTIESVDSISVRDTTTGMLWMKNGANNGISYNDVTTALADPNSNLYGWRVPTATEVENLWNSLFSYLPEWSSSSGSGFAITNSHAAEFNDLLTTFGASVYFGGTFKRTDGDLDLAFFSVEDWANPPYQIAGYSPSNYSVGDAYYWGTTLLVKDGTHVPEPSSVLLLGLGLLGLGLIRRRIF